MTRHQQPFLALGGHLPGSDRSPSQASSVGNIVVRNTFIEWNAPSSPQNQRTAQTCVARLSEPAPGFFPLPRSGVSLPEVTIAAEATDAPVLAGSPVGDPPSEGSKEHNQVDANGEPRCQPCAWFYKPTGCTNGAACRRCHLCPEGELKNRKKTKIQKMRNQVPDSPSGPGASGGASAASSAPDRASGTSTASPTAAR